MAKTRFTEIRLERIIKKLEPAMWNVLGEMANNEYKFEQGRRTAKSTLRRHRSMVEQFLSLDRNYHRAIAAANRIDHCEEDSDRHYATYRHRQIIKDFQDLCEFFER